MAADLINSPAVGYVILAALGGFMLYTLRVLRSSRWCLRLAALWIIAGWTAVILLVAGTQVPGPGVPIAPGGREWLVALMMLGLLSIALTLLLASHVQVLDQREQIAQLSREVALLRTAAADPDTALPCTSLSVEQRPPVGTATIVALVWIAFWIGLFVLEMSPGEPFRSLRSALTPGFDQ